MGQKTAVKRIRVVLRTGSIVFGLSAFALLLVPAVFNSWLGVTSTTELEWAMRMIGITLVALSGNMFSVSTRGRRGAVLLSGKVMLVAAFGLGVLTLMLPVQLNWFAIAYSLVGFGFSVAYALALFRK